MLSRNFQFHGRDPSDTIVTNLPFVRIIKQDTIVIVNKDIRIKAKTIFRALNVSKTTNAEMQFRRNLFVQAKVEKLYRVYHIRLYHLVIS